MTDAFAAALDATAERAVEIYARQIEAGHEEALARAFATAYAKAFGQGFVDSYETGRAQERARLKARHDDEQRWTAHRARFENRRRAPERSDHLHQGETPS